MWTHTYPKNRKINLFATLHIMSHYAPVADAANLVPAIVGSMGQCDSPLARAFFGLENMTTIQIELRNRIRCKTGYSIDAQSTESLIVIMRAMYALHAQNSPFAQDIPQELKRLNELVMAEIVPLVASNLAAYQGYVRDASQLPAPLGRGVNTSRRGTDVFSLFQGL